MAYNQELDARIRKVAANWENTGNKRMFGGVCHLLNGNMFCGVHKDFLILRLGVEQARDAMHFPFVRPFDITGRPMKGWVMVGEEGFQTDDELQTWLLKAKTFAETLPPK